MYIVNNMTLLLHWHSFVSIAFITILFVVVVQIQHGLHQVHAVQHNAKIVKNKIEKNTKFIRLIIQHNIPKHNKFIVWLQENCTNNRDLLQTLQRLFAKQVLHLAVLCMHGLSKDSERMRLTTVSRIPKRIIWQTTIVVLKAGSSARETMLFILQNQHGHYRTKRLFTKKPNKCCLAIAVNYKDHRLQH